MTVYPPWPEGPLDPPMPLTDVHVWMADITDTGALSLQGLSHDEVQHAESARSASFRNEFVRTRQILRELLGRYLRVPPATIKFQKNEHGKPSLNPPTGDGLQYNLSHSAGIALFAFACGRAVGIDIDRLDRVINWQSVAKRSFSEQEQRALWTLTDAAGQAAFMRGWVRKEAYTKARGVGFKYGFSNITVSLDYPGLESLLVADEHDPSAPQDWLLKDLPIPPPAAAALALEGETSSIRRWRV